MPTRPFPRLRRTACWLAGLLAGLGCVDRATGPDRPDAAVGLSPRFQVLGMPHQLAPGQRIAVRLRRLSGIIAADTSFAVGAGTGPLQLAIPVRVVGDRETMTLTLAVLGAAGDSLFAAGPLTVEAVSDRAAVGAEGPPVAAISLRYVGPGATTMRRVAFAVRDTALVFGDSATLVPRAFDQGNQPIAGVLFTYRSLDTTRVRVRSTGVVIAGAARGAGLVEVRSFTGLADTARVLVQPRPVAVQLVAGSGQTGTVGRVLPIPFTVRVIGPDSLGVRGVAVRFRPTLATSDSIVATDSNGFARYAFTLPTTAGATGVTARVDAIAGAPVTNFAATADADTATRLVVRGVPTSIAAGAPLAAVTVEARDAFDNLATSFTRPITVALTTNPGGGTLTGTLTRPAVAGIASFGDLALTIAASGYVLGASATGVVSGASNAFGITAGPPANVAVVRGASQLGNPLVPLADSVQVRVRDGFGNLVAGVPVTFAITAGGGTLGATSAVTDANGFAAVRWTMGASLGDATLTATAGTVTTAVLAVVAPVGTTRVWTGSVSADWATTGNWLPTGVPVATDVIAIAPKPSQPQLAAPTTIAALSVLPGANVTLNAPLRVQGSVAVDGAVLGPQPIVVAAPALASVRGTVPVLTLRTLVQLSGRLNTTTLVVDSVGQFTLQGNTAAVAGTLTVAQQGLVRMQVAAESLLVTGAASFGGAGSCATSMTAGVLRVSGGLTVPSVAGLCGSGTHVTELPSAGTQTIGGTTATFGDLVLGPIAAPAPVVFAPSTSWSVLGRVIVRTGVTAVTGAGSAVTLGGSLQDTVGGRWQVGNTTLTGTGPVEMPSAWGIAGGTTSITTSGTLQFVRLGAPGPIAIAGALIVDAGTFDVGPRTITVAEDFLTSATGRLRMLDPAGALAVRTAVFAGASTAGQLLAGQLTVNGALTQTATSSDSSFAAGAGHVVRLAGATTQDVSLATPGASSFGRLDIAGTAVPAAVIASEIVARDSVRLVGGTGVVSASGVGSRLVLLGAALRDPTVGTKRWQVPVVVRAANAQLPDTVGASVTLEAAVTLGGTNPWRRVRGALVIGAGGTLTMGGASLSVSDSLAVRGIGARLVMTNALDSLDVGAGLTGGGGATFDGDDHTGLLTNGVLVVAGDFRQRATISPRSFVASGAHRLRKLCPALAPACAAATSTDSLSFATGGAGQSVVQGLEIANGVGTVRTLTTLVGTVTVNGAYVQRVAAGIGRPAAGESRLQLAGSGATIERLIPTVPGGTVLQPRLLELPRGFAFAKTLTGTTVVQPETLAVTGTSGVLTEHTSVLDAAAPWFRLSTTGGTSQFATAGTLANITNVSIDGPTAVLGFPVGAPVTIAGDLRTVNGGAIVQTAGTTLTATNVTIAGGTSVLSDGLFTVLGNFAVTGTGRYDARAPHITSFDAPTTQVISAFPFDTLQSAFGNLRLQTGNGFSGSDSIATSIGVRGWLRVFFNRVAGRNVTVQVRDTVILENSGQLVGQGGLLVTTGVGVRTVGTTDDLAADTVAAEGSVPSETWTINGPGLRNVRVSKPAGLLRLAGGGTTVTGRVLVTQGTFKADSFQTITARTLQTTGTGTIQGITAGIPPAAPTFSVDSAIFGGGPGPINAGALTVRRAFVQGGAATSYQAGPQWLTSFTGALPKTVAFANPGAGQSYFTGLQLSGNRSVQLLSDVRVENATGISTQSPSDTILLNGRRLTVVGNLNVQGTIPFDLGGTVEVQGALGMLTGGTFAPDTFVQAGTARTIIRGTGAVFRNVVIATTGGAATFAAITDSILGSLIVRGTGANLTFQSDTINTFIVGGNLVTEAGGSFNMARAAGVGTRTVIVRGNASFGGSTSALISGTLEVRGNFTQGGGVIDAFAADSFHVTLLRPAGPGRTVSFANPGTLTSRFGYLQIASDLAPGQAITLGSGVFANGAFADSGAAGGQLRRLVSSGGTRTLTVRGVSMVTPVFGTLRRPRMLDSLVFDNVRLFVTGGGAVGDTLDRFTAFATDLLPATLQDIQFVNMPTTGASWLEMSTRSTLPATLLFNRLTFGGTAPTSPTSYIRMSALGTGTLLTTITGATPATLQPISFLRGTGAGLITATWNGTTIP